MPETMDVYRFRAYLEQSKTEAQIQQEIVTYLRTLGWVVLELRGNARRGGTVFQTKGLPDLYALRRGRAVWLEVKRPGQRPRSEQRRLHTLLRNAGAEVYVVTGIDALKEIL